MGYVLRRERSRAGIRSHCVFGPTLFSHASDLDEQRCRREQAEAVVGGVHRLDCLAGFFVAEHTCITAHQFYITQKDSNNR